jgi:glycosyltransferase involved in cell wall biosynthesis
MGSLRSIEASLAKASTGEAEIIVVDNASDDDTASVVRAFAASSAIPVNFQLERRIGLSKARNCALRAARGDLLIWTDDDCRLSEDHIRDALRHDAADTELVLRGGRIELGDALDLPLSIKTAKTRQQWRRSMRSARHENLGNCFAGCNMMMRRALVERLGPFDERFGVPNIRASEDTEYIFRAYVAGILIEYVPDMVVFHHHGRRGPDAGRQLMRNYLVGSGALYAKYLFKDSDLCRQFAWDTKALLREIRAGKNTFMPEIGFSNKMRIGYSMLGAAKYIASFVTRS